MIRNHGPEEQESTVAQDLRRKSFVLNSVLKADQVKDHAKYNYKALDTKAQSPVNFQKQTTDRGQEQVEVIHALAVNLIFSHLVRKLSENNVVAQREEMNCRVH